MAKNYSPEIATAVEEFFKKEELNYIPCNENGVIRSGMMLSSQIHRVDIKTAEVDFIVCPCQKFSNCRTSFFFCMQRKNRNQPRLF